MGAGASRVKRAKDSSERQPDDQTAFHETPLLISRPASSIRGISEQRSGSIDPVGLPFSTTAAARKPSKPAEPEEQEAVGFSGTFACQVQQSSSVGVKTLSVFCSQERSASASAHVRKVSTSSQAQQTETQIDVHTTQRSSMISMPETHSSMSFSASSKVKPDETQNAKSSSAQQRTQSLSSVQPMLSNLSAALTPAVNALTAPGSSFLPAPIPRARVQRPAPSFKGKALMPNGMFETISLNQYVGQYLILFFYPGDFTFVCPTEIIEFSDRAEEFKNIQCNVVACSVDSEYCHKAWSGVSRSKGGLGKLNIPILADPTRQIAQAYDVLLEEEGVALRGLFIIDPKGIVRQITINDLEVGRNVSEVKRLVEAFQYSDKYGSVCPQGWTAGKKTIIPDPEGAMQFFETVPIE